MRRSQSRRSSNIQPIRPMSFAAATASSSSKSVSSQQPPSSNRDGQKRSSSIPRPSLSSTMPSKGGVNRGQNSSLPLGTTPSKNNSMLRNPMVMATPQMGKSPQNRGVSICNSVAKPFSRETRNLSDKKYVIEMMLNIANFFSESGFPEIVGIREIQKIDKQSFIKYFNFMHQFIDRSYQLPPRFNEDELIRHLKEIGYCATLTKAALVSIGALHSTPYIVALLSWLADLVRMINSNPEDESFEKVELRLMINSYTAWCHEEPYDLKAELQSLYMQVHELEDGIIDLLEQDIAGIEEGCRISESKCSQIEDLKTESKQLSKKSDELSTKVAQLDQSLKENNQKEKHYVQCNTEAKEKIAALQNEIAQLGIAAKNCKLSAEEARRMRAQMAGIRRDVAAASEQRTEVAELFEKRELQLANVAADITKLTRKINVTLMDMGVAIEGNADRMEKIDDFLNRKSKELTELENCTLARIERKGQVSANISLCNLETKHIELQKKRCDEELQAVKDEQQEMERIYFSELAQLQSMATAPRSDPNIVRKKLDVDTLKENVAEHKAQMKKQEIELECKVKQLAASTSQQERFIKEAEEAAVDYYTRLFEGHRKLLQGDGKGLALEKIREQLIPPDF